MLNISVSQLQEIIDYAVNAGIARYEANRKPFNDRMTKSEARRYVVRMGYSVAQMKDWEENGLLKGDKATDSKTCPVYYSSAEIDKLITALKTKKIILDNV